MRRLLRSMMTLRGAVMMFVALMFFLFVMSHAVFSALAMQTAGRPNVTPTIINLAPLAMLSLTLISIFTSAGERAIYFSPSEVDFLFAGPFSRRQLLIYKLATSIAGAAATALFLSLTLLAFSPWWPTTLLAIFFSLLFMNLVTLVVSLIGQTIAESAVTKTRKIAGAAVILLLILGLSRTIAQLPDQDAFKAVSAFTESIAGQILLFPFYAFKMLFQAQDWTQAAIWVPVCLVLDGALLLTAISLDANYLESAAEASRRVDARQQRVRRSGLGGLLVGSSSQWKWSLPMLPRWFGFGPVVWLQLTAGLRGARSFLTLIGIVTIAAAIIGVTLRHKLAGNSNRHVGFGIGALGYLSFLIAMNPPLGFRASGDQIPWFKTMPLRPMAIAFGQTAGITLILTSLQWLILALMAVGLKASVWLLWAAAIGLPFNFFMFGMDNLSFLIFPVRMTASAPGDVQVVGRVMIQSLLKMGFTACFGLPILLLGSLLWIWTKSLHAFPFAAFVLLTLGDVLLVFLIARVFQRFDPSLDHIAG